MNAAESYKQRFSEEAFYNLYISDIGIHPSVGLDKITGPQYESRLKSNIKIALSKIHNCTFSFTNYRQILMTKSKDDTPREICIPCIRDKLVLGTLSGLLDDIYGNMSKTTQPQLVVDSVKKCISGGNFDTFIKIDIRKFYANVDHAKLKRILRRKIRKREVLSLLFSAISTPSSTHEAKVRQRRGIGIPEGLSISNKLANIYASDIDCAFINRSDCEYFRYVDDILVLCNSSNMEAIDRTIHRVIKKLSLRVNEDKLESGSLDNVSFDYLGYYFQPNGRISVKARSVRNLESALENIIRSRDYKSNHEYWKWKLNLRISGCKIKYENNSYERYGWLYYFSRVNDIGLLCHLDWLVCKLFTRYQIEKPTDILSFKKAYYEIRYKADRTSYIPSYGDDLPIAEKRRMLALIFRIDGIENMQDIEVENVFNGKIRREARRLERDIGLIS